jgi:hypothetical protein
LHGKGIDTPPVDRRHRGTRDRRAIGGLGVRLAKKDENKGAATVALEFAYV